MIKRCIVHFGLSKTGSSSIQHFLRRELRDDRFFYPSSGEGALADDICHNRAVWSAFSRRPEVHHAHFKEGVSQQTLRERGERFRRSLRDLSQAEADKTMILSAEDLSWLRIEELEELADFLRGLTKEIVALAYVRPFKEDQESRFQQGLREPGTRQLQNAAHPLIRPTYYRRRIEGFCTVFGLSKVKLNVFAPATFESNCVVRDFCQQLSISNKGSSGPRVNKGLSLDAVKFLYCYRLQEAGNGLTHATGEANHLLIEKLAELEGPRVAFHSTLLARNKEDWRHDVEWISDLLGEDMLGNLYADDNKPCLRSEADLLDFAPDSLEWLAFASGTKSSSLKAADPQLVARSVGLLRDRAVDKAAQATARKRQWFRLLEGFYPNYRVKR